MSGAHRGSKLCEQHGEQRRGGIQDGGEAAADLRLAVGDEAEWDEVVERAHAGEGAQVRTEVGMRPPVARTTTCRMRAAMPRRRVTAVKGRMSASATR